MELLNYYHYQLAQRAENHQKQSALDCIFAFVIHYTVQLSAV